MTDLDATSRPPVKGFSPYAVVVLLLATVAAGWLGYTALKLEPPPDPAGVHVH